VISEGSAVALPLLATLYVLICKSSTDIITTAIRFLKESKLVAKVFCMRSHSSSTDQITPTYIRPSDFAPRVVQFGDSQLEEILRSSFALAQRELAVFLIQFALNDFPQFALVHFKHVIVLVFGSPDNAVAAAEFGRNILGQERLRDTQTLATFQQEVQRFMLAALAKADIKLGSIFFGISGSTFETPGGFTPIPIPNFRSMSPRKLIEADVKGWAWILESPDYKIPGLFEKRKKTSRRHPRSTTARGPLFSTSLHWSRSSMSPKM
jgi:hypothetical protein